MPLTNHERQQLFAEKLMELSRDRLRAVLKRLRLLGVEISTIHDALLIEVPDGVSMEKVLEVLRE